MFGKFINGSQGIDRGPNKGLNRLPIVYVRNNTEENIENISFSFDNVVLIGSEIKKVKPNMTKNVSLYLTYRQRDQLEREDYDLIMNHGKENKYTISEAYGAEHIRDILIEIMKVYNDGSLGIKIEENYLSC